MKIREIHSKAILSTSQIYDYTVNPYVGCQHACSYCYARFMKRFSGHTEPWGDFVDVKVNASDLLRAEIGKKKKGSVWISGVCDPYQPLEAEYELTRRCLEILVQDNWPVVVQTRSPLVLRDLDILKRGKAVAVGLSITSANEEVRRIFEPHAPPIMKRVEAVGELHRNGIRTFVMIAPMLPEAEGLVRVLEGKVDYVILDRMNYHHADRIYAERGWRDKNTEGYFKRAGSKIVDEFRKLGIDCTTTG